MTTYCSDCGRDITKNEEVNEKFVVCNICNKFTAKGSNHYKVEEDKNLKGGDENMVAKKKEKKIPSIVKKTTEKKEKVEKKEVADKPKSADKKPTKTSQIRELSKQGKSVEEIMEIVGVDKGYVEGAINGKKPKKVKE